MFEVERLDEALPERSYESQIDPDPPIDAGCVVPIRPQPPPDPADELERCRRILSAAGLLADLSGRLERARPPPSAPAAARFAKVPA
jgi:hypothetical protein